MYVKSNFKDGTSKSISASIKAEIDEKASAQIKNTLNDIAEDVVNKSISSVKTGAFITSWSIVPAGSGAGRSRSSRNKPLADPAQKASEALTQLEADIAALDLTENKNTVLRNRAPHAPSVERKYQITTSLKDRYR